MHGGILITLFYVTPARLFSFVPKFFWKARSSEPPIELMQTWGCRKSTAIAQIDPPCAIEFTKTVGADIYRKFALENENRTQWIIAH